MDDTNDDTHLCLRCKKTIIGLENYIIHRRQMCMYLLSSSNETSMLSPSIESEHRENPYIVHLSADHFFSSLELQSKTTAPKNSIVETTESQRISTLSDSSLFSDQILSKNDNASCKISNVEIDFHLDVSNSSEDCQNYFYPPRSHTGGKWKPGTRPDIDNRRQWDVHSYPPSPADEIDTYDEISVDTKTEKLKHTKEDINSTRLESRNTSETFPKEINQKKTIKTNLMRKNVAKNKSENNENDCKCAPCNKNFENKMKLMIHLLSSEHQNKFDSVDQWHNAVFCHQQSLVYTSLFQCLICRYFFNNDNALMTHLKTACHIQKVKQLKEPLVCLSCNFECHGSNNLLNHILSKNHQKQICCVSHYHPIVIKNKSMHCICCNWASNCQLQDTHLRQENVISNSINREQSANNNNPKNTQVQVPTIEEILSNSELLNSVNEEQLKCTDCNSNSVSSIELNEDQNSCNSNQRISKIKNIIRRTKSSKKKKESEYDSIQIIKSENNEKTKHNDKKQIIKKFLCPYCSKPYPKHHLKFHIFTHTGEKPFKCYICSRGFAQRSTLQVHIKRHLGLKRFKCDKCDFRTVRRSVLLRHQEIHKSNRPRNCLCDICGSPQLDQWSLKQHMKIHTKSTHKCTHSGCHLTFRSPSELLYHLRVHTNERPYLCDICGYCGKTPHQLKKHQRSHTGERPFKCKHCNYSATLSSHLLRHMRLHTGSKPYKCPYCPYACNTQENIRKHILKTKKHAGKKMYPCKFCDFACNEFQDYREHLSKQHADQFPNGEKQIDSSVIAGVYVKDFPRQVDEVVPYSPRKKSPEVAKKQKKKKDKSNTRTDIKHSEMESQKTAMPETITNSEICDNEQPESVLYIEIPPASLPQNVSSENIFKDISNESNLGTQVSIDNLINRTVSESYTYSDDGTGTQILVSNGLDCINTDEMSNLIDPSTLHIIDNTENIIFIYVPFT
ncbi:zinc finger protein 585A-like [Centruroides sculpturatus]|uniref:zinc finger protein 585A-like n=1 Tax=Centruroides sculpturatus TaxID=218467 RepID=UPI000C6E7B06|nr:zinc finger protein 585A-like [Centruroides sculpturatus]